MIERAEKHMSKVTLPDDGGEIHMNAHTERDDLWLEVRRGANSADVAIPLLLLPDLIAEMKHLKRRATEEAQHG